MTLPTFSSELFAGQTGFVERCFYELQAKTAGHDAGWGLGRAAWDADLQAGLLTFTNENFRATCPVQVIGTYDTQNSSWLWGWDHPSVPAPLAAHARLVRDFAEREGLDALLPRKLECSEDDAWAFAALATHLADAQGAYRGPAGSAVVFMTFGTVTLEAP